MKRIFAALALITLASTQTEARDTHVRIQPQVLRLAQPLQVGKKKKLRIYVGAVYKTGISDGKMRFAQAPSIQTICTVEGDGSREVRLDEVCNDVTRNVTSLRRYAAEHGYSEFQAMISYAIVEARFNFGNAIGFGKRTLAAGSIHLEDLNDCESRGSCRVDSLDIYDAPGNSASMIYSFDN